MITTLRNKVDSLVWGDTLEKRGWFGRRAAVTLRYVYALLRDMFTGQLMMRAMSLVYTTLLSVVPLIAFSFSVLKGLGYHNQVEPLLFQFLEPLGDKGAEITRQIIDLVDNVKGGVLGGVSLAFFIYTAISMVQKVEESLNYVWYVATRRNFAHRVTEYMVVMLIGPLVIGVALSMIVSLQSNSIVQFFVGVEWLAPALAFTSNLTPYLLVIGVFTFLYMYLPNTTVRFRSALVGAIASGFTWATLSAIFATFVVYSTRIQLVYSGFAVAVLALIWLYLNWLILLVGSQLAFYHQNPAFLRLGHREPRLSNAMRERIALNIMFKIGNAFRKPGDNVSVHSLAHDLRIPSITLAPIIAALEDERLITTTENESIVPGREMTRIRLNDVLRTVRERGETGSHRQPRWDVEIDELGQRLDTAVADTVRDQTLVDLLDAEEQA